MAEILGSDRISIFLNDVANRRTAGVKSSENTIENEVASEQKVVASMRAALISSLGCTESQSRGSPHVHNMKFLNRRNRKKAHLRG